MAAEPLLVRSFLRLVLIALIALLVHYNHVAHRNSGAFDAILVCYATGAVTWLVYVLTQPRRWWFGWASTAVDVVMVLALCIASGPATLSLYPIFFLLPISVAFLDNPVITGALGLSVSFGYLFAWVLYATGDNAVNNRIPALVYIQVGCLLWLTAAITALSFTLARRREKVRVLLDGRHRLLAELMRADERHGRSLSEQLHDGPLQNLLAARLDLDELRENPTGEGFERLDVALRDTIGALRSTVSTLHPQVLAQVGLTAAVRELAVRHQQRWGVPVHTEIDEVGRPAASALVYRAARELLSNVHKHSRATRVDLALYRGPGETVLRVADDGVGFDPRILQRRVGEGHIGLASLVVGVEAAGGSMDFRRRDGGGTVVRVIVPDQPDTGAT
jgi:two-component system NarL family sensor kinase